MKDIKGKKNAFIESMLKPSILTPRRTWLKKHASHIAALQQWCCYFSIRSQKLIKVVTKRPVFYPTHKHTTATTRP